MPGAVAPAVDGPPMLIFAEEVPPTELVTEVVAPWPDNPVAGIVEAAADRIAALVAEMGLAAPAPWGIATAESFAGVVTLRA